MVVRSFARSLGDHLRRGLAAPACLVGDARGLLWGAPYPPPPPKQKRKAFITLNPLNPTTFLPEVLKQFCREVPSPMVDCKKPPLQGLGLRE